LPLEADDISALYRGHARTLLIFFARRVYDPEAAVDLVAETFAAAFAGRGRFEGADEADAMAWIYGIARHQLSHFYRRGRVERAALARLGVAPRALTEPEYERIEDLAGLAPLRAAVAAALERLPGDQRQAVELRVVHERSYAEVAEALRISEQAARARVSRGLRRLAGGALAVSGGDPLSEVTAT
jgi:RNA polymerase sigma-70 factor (ECF subfamily)